MTTSRPSRRGRLDRVVGDRGRVRPALAADELGAGALGPDLELLLGGRAERVGGAEHDGVAVLAQALGELADRRRLAGAVDADDEDDARLARRTSSVRGLAEQRAISSASASFRSVEVLARLEALHELGGRADADVGADQRFLEPLPGRGVTRDRTRPTRAPP